MPTATTFADSGSITTESIRRHFPSLKSSTLYLDNAGGSQVPLQVTEAMRGYFLHTCAQTGAAYPASVAAAGLVAKAHTVAKAFVNGEGLGEVILAQSTTALVHTLSNAYADALHNGSIHRRRIVVSTLGHEANIWAWFRLAARGFEVVAWHPKRTADNLWTLDHESLDGLVDERTLLVAFPQVSNIMGQVEDAKSICRMAERVGARTLVDGVAFAPHRAPDVVDLRCDWYVYSTYKVFGPHAAAAFGRSDAFAELDGPNHYFLPRTMVPYTFELGGVPHESAAGIAALDDYLHALTGQPPAIDGAARRRTFVQAFDAFGQIEDDLQTRLLKGLAELPNVQIAGSPMGGPERICTVSFHVRGVRSSHISAALNARNIGIKSGNFYSRRLVERMALDPADGVVRISLAHYNTIDEVETVLSALRTLLHAG